MMAKRFGLALLVFSQFAGTSLWFVGNAVADGLAGNATLRAASLTSAVQLGFVSGTLLFSLLSLADRIAPHKLFFSSASFAALVNILLVPFAGNAPALLTLRFMTGFLLAGIYPVGMKLAAEKYPQAAGKALGFLVGALVFGTAFPHLVRAGGGIGNWHLVIVVTSALAATGGLLVFLFLKSETSTTKQQPGLSSTLALFRNTGFRSAAFGYFGHMWELYTVWALLPLMIAAYNSAHSSGLSVPLTSFAVIAAGGVGCVLGGLLSQRVGNRLVAFVSLLFSGVCCGLFPIAFNLPSTFFLLLLLFWGLTVAADSPQFSAMVAHAAKGENRGSALTLVTSIGFAITVISIQLLQAFFASYHQYATWLLLPGPALGLLALRLPKKLQ